MAEKKVLCWGREGGLPRDKAENEVAAAHDLQIR